MDRRTGKLSEREMKWTNRKIRFMIENERNFPANNEHGNSELRGEVAPTLQVPPCLSLNFVGAWYVSTGFE